MDDMKQRMSLGTSNFTDRKANGKRMPRQEPVIPLNMDAPPLLHSHYPYAPGATTTSPNDSQAMRYFVMHGTGITKELLFTLRLSGVGRHPVRRCRFHQFQSSASLYLIHTTAIV